jgi:glucose-1-phosphate thymidylyltransferase
MAEYPLKKMIEAGVDEVLVVSGGENFAAVVKYFGSGYKWGIHITHAIQDRPGGIAHALMLAKSFVGENHVLVCLGDNVFNMSIRADVEMFASQPYGHALLFSIRHNKPERFGVIKFNGADAVDIVEKPAIPPSDQIITGIYAYGPEVFDIIRTLHPSARGELEITDVNRFYLKAGQARIIEMDGWWSDCGTIETLNQAEEYLKNDRLILSVHT